RALPPGPGRRERLRQALATYERLLRNDWELLTAHRRRVAIAQQLGGLESVYEEYARRSAAYPTDPYARYGAIYALLHRPQPPLHAASDALDELLELDPRFAAAHLAQGWVRE